MDIGDKISYLRKFNKLKQIELADILEIPITTLSGYENNHRVPPLDILNKLAQSFNVSLDFFVDENFTTTDMSIYILIEKLISKTKKEVIQWTNILKGHYNDSHLFDRKKTFINTFFKTITQFKEKDIQELYGFVHQEHTYFLQKINNKPSKIVSTYLCVLKETKDESNPQFPFIDFQIIATDIILPEIQNSNTLELNISPNLNTLLINVKKKDTNKNDFLQDLHDALDLYDK